MESTIIQNDDIISNKLRSPNMEINQFLTQVADTFQLTLEIYTIADTVDLLNISVNATVLDFCTNYRSYHSFATKH
jgi:hypothetical protein